MKTVVITLFRWRRKQDLLCSGLWVSFPDRYWSLFFMSKDVLGAFSATSRVSLGFAQSILFCRPLIPRFIKFLVKALPGDNVRFAWVRLRHNNREPVYSPSLRCFLWTFWLMGIFFELAMTEIPKWKFLTMRCTNYIGVISKY